MKDYDVLNEVWEQEVLEDFDGFLAAEKWSDCETIIQMLGDQGRENTAIRMNHLLNQARALGYVELFTPVIPVLSEEERLAGMDSWEMPHKLDRSDWTREGDENFPNRTY